MRCHGTSICLRPYRPVPRADLPFFERPDLRLAAACGLYNLLMTKDSLRQMAHLNRARLPFHVDWVRLPVVETGCSYIYRCHPSNPAYRLRQNTYILFPLDSGAGLLLWQGGESQIGLDNLEVGEHLLRLLVVDAWVDDNIVT